MSFVIVIPSRTASNLVACIASIRAAGETARVIVVWDGEWSEAEAIAPKLGGDVEFMRGEQPFCFARNCNIGIREAMGFDVVLCNDDVLLETERGFSAMALQWPEFGILSARVKGPANPVHQFDGREANDITIASFVPFCCVLLQRAMLDEIGLIDERFVPGSWEDNDLCKRAIDGGYWKVGVYNACVVDHQTLPHTFRPEGKPQLYELDENRKRFKEKWGKR